MIVEFFWGLVTGIVSGLFSLLPDVAVDLGPLTTSGAAIGGYAAALDGYFPVATLAVCLVIVLGLKLALSVWGVVLFVYEHIPFKAT